MAISNNAITSELKRIFLWKNQEKIFLNFPGDSKYCRDLVVSWIIFHNLQNENNHLE